MRWFTFLGPLVFVWYIMRRVRRESRRMEVRERMLRVLCSGTWDPNNRRN